MATARSRSSTALRTLAADEYTAAGAGASCDHGRIGPERYSEQLDALRERFPGWRIYARKVDNMTERAQWSAQPEPMIVAASAEELAERIGAAHSQPHGSLVLASWPSYTARARRFREYEAAVADEWERRKAGQAARMADPVASFYLRHEWQAEAAAEAPDSAHSTGTGARSLTRRYGVPARLLSNVGARYPKIRTYALSRAARASAYCRSRGEVRR